MQNAEKPPSKKMRNEPEREHLIEDETLNESGDAAPVKVSEL